jgi:NAD(P)-dependent dehydrogenase (short-subunit alcohol dehydrogenase family)
VGARSSSTLDAADAVVADGGKGIGRATAERLIADGARVASVNLEPEAPGLAIAADVSDEAAVEDAFARARAELGGLDVVIRQRAIHLVGSDDRADRLDAHIWRRTVDFNLTGVFLTAKRGARALLADGGGAIVCTGSPVGHYGIAAGLDAYSASKAGVFGLARVMAIDYAAEGIRIDAVFPGVSETPMNRWWMDDPERRTALEASIPLGRAARAGGDRCGNRVPRLRSDVLCHCSRLDRRRRADRLVAIPRPRLRAAVPLDCRSRGRRDASEQPRSGSSRCRPETRLGPRLCATSRRLPASSPTASCFLTLRRHWGSGTSSTSARSVCSTL